MELREYLEIARRQRWIIIEAIVIVAAVAVLLTAMKSPVYESSAAVLLRPNDPSETIGPADLGSIVRDLDRHMDAQVGIVQSPAVVEKALEMLGPRGQELLAEGSVRAGQVGDSDVMSIRGSHPEPEGARDLANAFSEAYIENRREYAIAGLQKASDELGAKLAELQSRIAELDAQIGDGGLDPNATAAIQAPAGQPQGPQQPAQGPTPPSSDQGAQRSDSEALKAARFAAAVQYQTLFQRQQELQVEINLKRGEAEILRPAGLPLEPAGASPLRNGVLGGFVGLLLGVGIAFLREQLDDRVRSREEMVRITNLPVVAELPYDKDSYKSFFVATVTDPLGGLAEATRSLRTSVQFYGVDQPVKRLVVTSPEPGDGKTVVAANLAASYAQAGYMTVLVSADLRRPTLEPLFGIEPGTDGLTNLIASLRPDGRLASLVAGNGHHVAGGNGFAAPGRNGNGNGNGNGDAPKSLFGAAMDVAVTPDGVPNLYVIASGPLPPNPSELLASRRCARLFEELASEADMVIIDTPPVLAVTDAAVVADRADAVLVVASADETHRGPVKKAIEVLDATRAPVIGTVLNKVDPAVTSAYKAYYAGYPVVDDTKKRRGRRRKDKVAVDLRSPGSAEKEYALGGADQ